MRWNGEKFEEVLNNDLDRLLTAVEKQELNEQIEGDTDFKSIASWYYLLHELLQDVASQDERTPMPSGFTEGVMRSLADIPAYTQSTNRFALTNRVKLFMGLAACVAVFAFMLWNPGESMTEQLDRARPSVLVDAGSIPVGASDGIQQQSNDLKILAATGQVQVFKEHGFVWQDIGGQITVNIRDKVRTLAGGSIHLAYHDGVELKLKPNSLVALESDGLRVFHGDSWIHVSRKGRKFQTKTPNLVASVRGTIYDVSVRYTQQSYSEFVSGVTAKNALKGTDPALYFRDVSLDTLNEMGNRQFASAVESSVRVFESSVDVNPLDPISGEIRDGVEVNQGNQIRLVSVSKALKNSQINPLNREDFHYWNMGVPDFMVETIERSPELPLPKSQSDSVETDSSGSTNLEVSPRDAMGTITD